LPIKETFQPIVFNELDLESMTNNSMKLVEVLEPFQKVSKPLGQKK
jgi:hypothetical protein